MKREDREFLSVLRTILEDRFAGVVVGWEGFDKPYLGGVRDGFLVVEVFNVPDEQMEMVLVAGEELAKAHLLKGGSFVTFSLWTPEETKEYFSEELKRLGRLRSRVLPSRMREQELLCDIWSGLGCEHLPSSQNRSWSLPHDMFLAGPGKGGIEPHPLLETVERLMREAA